MHPHWFGQPGETRLLRKRKVVTGAGSARIHDGHVYVGSNNRNMPAYIVLISQGTGKNPGQPIFSRLWGSGFLPSKHQGVALRSQGDPVLYLSNPKGVSPELRRAMLDGIVSAAGYPREKVRLEFRVGNPIDELLKLIMAEDIDVIVMGPKGRTDLEHILVGSVAEKIFRRSPAVWQVGRNRVAKTMGLNPSLW